MKKGSLRPLVRYGKLIIALLFAWMTSVMIHENFHLLVFTAEGVKAHIEYVTLFDYIPLTPFKYVPLAGVVRGTISSFSQSQLYILALSGGIGAAIFPWLPFWYVARSTWERGDVWLEGVSASVILTQLFYAPTELLLIHSGFRDVTTQYIIMAGLATLAAQILFYALYTKKLINWLGAAAGTPTRKQARVAEKNDKK